MDTEARPYPRIQWECAIYAEISCFYVFRATDARAPDRATHLARRLTELPEFPGELMPPAAGPGRLAYPVAPLAPLRTRFACFAPGAPYAGTSCGASSGRSRNSSRIPGAALAAKAGA